MNNTVFQLPDTRAAVNTIRLIEKIQSQDKPWTVDFKQKKMTRRTRANNLYWKWVSIIAKDRGFDKDDLHDEFKRHFLGYEEYTGIDGKIHKRLAKSSRLKIEKFSEYMNKVAAYAASEGIRLPSKEEYGYE